MKFNKSLAYNFFFYNRHVLPNPMSFTFVCKYNGVAYDKLNFSCVFTQGNTVEFVLKSEIYSRL